MKVYRFCAKVLVVILCLCSWTSVLAQQNGSAASVSRSRAIVNSGSYPPVPSTITAYPSSYPTYNAPPPVFKIPEEIAVEEFVNYHKHWLPLPKVGQAVAMDTRWGNGEVSRTQREAVLQIGFTTAEVNERTDLRPLNLVLVIDKSGSMADSDKMSRVQEGLRTMITKLRPDDVVSIVGFDSSAQVLYRASRIGNGDGLRYAIDCLAPGGSTNIHSGLMLGYAEAQRNFRPGATNRVILLTDGIANTGVVDPARIAADSSEFNRQGIDLSTIGVGLDLNNDLLRTLARSGRGLYHFISDYKDINKVFVNEVQSLISSVAKKVEVKIEHGPHFQLQKIYGYSPRYGNGSVSITLDNMNNGLTQVVMAKFRTDSVKSTLPVKVRLSYYDVRRKCMVEEVQELRLAPAESESCDLLADVEVKKNYTIAELADSLFTMTEFARRGNFLQAQSALDASVTTAYQRYPNMEDGDIKFILDIVEGYQRDLKLYNSYSRKPDCGSCRPDR
ncbi:MAG TPA: VWA domain-containing protein [Pyrinomonadaceae bacterium]|nr:VWA domain-containing protein [Pyrinomonadaceae bacterium]